MAKIVLGLILLVVLGGGGWYLYQQQSGRNTTTPPTTNQQTAQNETSQASTAPMADSKLESEAYVNAKYGFKIKPPKGWVANENVGQGLVVSFSNPNQEGEDAGASINVTQPQPTEGASMATMIEETKKALPTVLTNYKVVEDRKATVNGKESHVLGGTFVQGTANLRNRQLIVINKDMAFVVTATNPQSTWDKNSELVEASLMSFEAL